MCEQETIKPNVYVTWIHNIVVEIGDWQMLKRVSRGGEIMFIAGEGEERLESPNGWQNMWTEFYQYPVKKKTFEENPISALCENKLFTGAWRWKSQIGNSQLLNRKATNRIYKGRVPKKQGKVKKTHTFLEKNFSASM